VRWYVLCACLVAGAALAVGGRGLAATPGYANTHGATIAHYSLRSALVGRRLDEVAILAPGGDRHRLLVLLHGRHDESRAGFAPMTSGPESMLSDALFAALAELGHDAPTVVLLNGGRHSWYHDRRNGRWASMILDEAIPDAVRRFHAGRARIAIGGISMGGYGAFHVAALRPHEFCAVGGHSAALYETFDASAPVAFDSAADFVRNDVFRAARAGRFEGLPVWIDGGSYDPFRAADATFASLLRGQGAPVTYHVWPGGHTASYWRAHMAEYLRFYASALAACRASWR
jgi:S-formylglutathione hydrolase FrmB